MKQCSKCKEIKSIDEFHDDKTHKDGKRSLCKGCCKKYTLTKQGKVAIKKYLASEKSKARRKRYRQSEKGKAANRKDCSLHRARYPIREQARKTVSKATARGDILRASELQCSDCNSQAEQYHHYNGYEKEHWFDVIPVCRICHLSRHAT